MSLRLFFGSLMEVDKFQYDCGLSLYNLCQRFVIRNGIFKQINHNVTLLYSMGLRL